MNIDWISRATVNAIVIGFPLIVILLIGSFELFLLDNYDKFLDRGGPRLLMLTISLTILFQQLGILACVSAAILIYNKSTEKITHYGRIVFIWMIVLILVSGIGILAALALPNRII